MGLLTCWCLSASAQTTTNTTLVPYPFPNYVTAQPTLTALPFQASDWIPVTRAGVEYKIGATAFTGITQLTGPVTTSTGGGSQATTITNGAVTNSKLANSATTVNGVTCTLGSTCTVPAKQRLAIGWPTAIDPSLNIIATVDEASTVTSIVGSVSTAVGAAATVSIYKAPSGTACSAGTVLHSGSFDANGTANTNQTLTVTTTALSAGDRLCLVTTNSSNWTSGSGIGGVTVRITTP